MRRGLMAWSRDEVPAEVLERRVANVLAGLRPRSLDCLVVYTDLTRPAAVCALTQFVPYWSNGVLLAGAGIGATFVGTLPRRVSGWMHAMGRFDNLVHTLNLGEGVAQALPRPGGAHLRIGVVELASFPSSVIGAIRSARPDARFEEADDLLASALAGGDSSPLAGRAHDIARSALRAAEEASAGRVATAVLAAAELAGRRAGAEEIQLAIAPDAASNATLRRLEGDAALGETFALQATVAYKGCWIRLGRTLAAGPAPAWLAETDAWFSEVLREIQGGALVRAVLESALARLPQTQLEWWRLETARGGLPLAVVDGSHPFATDSAFSAPHASLTLRLRHRHTFWFAAAPTLCAV